MTSRRKWFAPLIPALFVCALSLPLLAQTAPAGDGGDGGGGRRGRFDPAEFRQRQLDRVKETLGASDDEFKALQPKLEHVMQAQRDIMAARFASMWGGGRGGRGGGGSAAARGGADGEQNPSPVAQKVRDLRDTLDNKDAKPEEIKAKLDALREAKTKAREDLTKSQSELREVLTQRQEAALVMMGILD